MGWLVVVAVRQLLSRVEPTSLILLAIGGVCYTVGVIFYLWRRLPYNHTIWHLFVLGGSITHYFAVINIL
jgi:hemolysin III